MKKTSNKGFSLVELIVVIAIMGVLMVVLAPQYLRYVEKSRLQKDNSMISEIAEVIKIACADDNIAQNIAGKIVISTGNTANANKEFDFADGSAQNTGTGKEGILGELRAAIADKPATTSSTYKTVNTPIKFEVEYSTTSGSYAVTGFGIITVPSTTTTTSVVY